MTLEELTIEPITWPTAKVYDYLGENRARNEEIVATYFAARKANVRIAEICKKYGLTMSRIFYIIKQYRKAQKRAELEKN